MQFDILPYIMQIITPQQLPDSMFDLFNDFEKEQFRTALDFMI